MINREEIRNKFGGKCAYCGKPLGKTFHVDHIKPIFRGWEVLPPRAGSDFIENMNPSCPRCNIRKGTLTIEQFRIEIQSQVNRLRRDSSAFRLAEDFGTVREVAQPVSFCFECAECGK